MSQLWSVAFFSLSLALTGGMEQNCEEFCGAGTACKAGKCEAVEVARCSPACGACEVCDTSGSVPACLKLCGPNAICDAAKRQCVSAAEFHKHAPQLAGPFPNGYAVTKACLGCHAKQAKDFMGSIHWKWQGPTPQLVGPDGKKKLNPGTLGKKNLVNNFCIAVPSNEKRCDQCHAGYGGDPDPGKPQKSARAYVRFDPKDPTADSSIPLAERIDCLVCHSNPAAAYAKDPKSFGNPLSTLNLAAAAKDVRLPMRTNCGACHFYAGGADSVKLMGSSLKNPTVALDVHMGNGVDCSDCHATAGHKFRGAGVHVPANVERAACTDCHGTAPHEGKVASNGETLDEHTAKIACQTCHIPAFSRGQFAKVEWDWSTAGDNTKGVAGVVTTRVNELGLPDPQGTAVTTYDFLKGDFKWMKNVKPTYAWYNGQMRHTVVTDKADYRNAGLTADDAARISLASPMGSASDPAAKIYPFKLFRGRQAVFVDGANSFVAVPNLFGPAALWGIIQAPGYKYAGRTAMEALWTTSLAKGMAAAGQIPAGAPAARFNGTKGWDWRYTKLYLDLNHEVAPKGQALGAGGCADCHSASSKLPLCELYQGAKKPHEVTCP